MSAASASERVVIVGAGIGGLTAAVSLAAAGRDVVVLERAAAAGGKMREIQVAGVAVDAGPTVLTMRWVFDELFESVGGALDEHLTLTRAEVLARHAWNADARLDLFADPDRTAEAIGDFAGAREAQGFRAFQAEARRIFATLREPFLRSQATSALGLSRRIGLAHAGQLLAIRPFEGLWRALGGHFRDPRLQQLFGRYATYCGSSPFAAPATLMLIAHAEQEGVWLVDGGMQRLSEALEALARSLGATFRYSAHVSEIHVTRGAATGVTLAGGERVEARAVLVNADPQAVALGAFGRDAAVAAAPMAPAARSLSALTWTLSAKTSGFPLARHNVFFSGDYAAEFDDILRRGQLPTGPTVYVCAQDRSDRGAAPMGEERLMALVNAPPRGDLGPPSPSEIAECETKVFEHLARCGLTVSRRPEATVVTTPQDLHRMFPQTGGALYGRATHGWAASFQRPGARTRIAGLYLAGGACHPGAGGADGGAVRPAGGAEPGAGPGFDAPVPPGGYAWWYIDALSEDGRHGLTLIAFVGSVFSPYYAWRGRRDPLDHCAVNVALYGPGGGRWAMTERGRGALQRDAATLAVGPSRLDWSGDTLTAHIDEITAPLPGRLRGTIRLSPGALGRRTYALDRDGRHLWRPIAPRARVAVDFDHPGLSWRGEGYFDANAGAEPLEKGFRSWDWSRAHLRRDTAIFYDTVQRDGGESSLSLRIGADGEAHEVEASHRFRLPTTGWRLPRATRGTSDDAPTVSRTLEDTPFYARSALTGTLFGEPASILHESLSLSRFQSPVVRAMLPFRMPRALW